MKITFFGTQPYDRESFDRANERYGFEFNYHRSHLNGNNPSLAQGADAVCIFVNDTADAATSCAFPPIRRMPWRNTP